MMVHCNRAAYGAGINIHNNYYSNFFSIFCKINTSAIEGSGVYSQGFNIRLIGSCLANIANQGGGAYIYGSNHIVTMEFIENQDQSLVFGMVLSIGYNSRVEDSVFNYNTSANLLGSAGAFAINDGNQTGINNVFIERNIFQGTMMINKIAFNIGSYNGYTGNGYTGLHIHDNSFSGLGFNNGVGIAESPVTDLYHKNYHLNTNIYHTNQLLYVYNDFVSNWISYHVLTTSNTGANCGCNGNIYIY